MRTGTKKIFHGMAASAIAALLVVPAFSDPGVDFGMEDDLTVYGAAGTAVDPDLEVKGFAVFGATQSAYTGGAAGPGNVVVNGALTVSSGAYLAGSSTFTSAGNVFMLDGATGQVLGKSSAGNLQWLSASALGDSLGTHVATKTLDMASFNIVNVSSVNFKSNVFLASATAGNYGGVYVSTNLYVAGKYYGDGSSLSGIGDNLGNHIATTTLQMGVYGVNTSSVITAAAYQINGSTIVAVLPGGNSIAYGLNAGRSNTTGGNSNVFIGNNSGYSNATADGNSFLGFSAGFFNTTGNSNSFIGYQAGYSHNSGDYDSFLGASAGFSNTSGNSNSFIGSQAGYSNTTGNNNSFLGKDAGYSNTTGNDNSFLGFSAGYYTQAGSQNTILGYYAGNGASGQSYSSATIMGAGAGYNLTTGSNNIFLGWQAGYSVTTGSGNIVIGYNKGVSAAAASNELNIGNVLYGKLDARTVGISTRVPQAALDIVSTGTAANVYAQIWRDGTGVPVASMTSLGTLYATLANGDNWGSAVVQTNATLTGNGTGGSQLGINLANANSWSDTQTFTKAGTTTGAATLFSAGTNVIAAMFGSGSTSGFTADQYGGAVRFNGAAVSWGDLSYYPYGNNAGSYGDFRFSKTGSVLSTVPNARVGVGEFFSVGNVGISTASPQARLDVLAGGAGPGTMATIWRNSAGTIVSSVSATGVIMASKFIGDGSGLTGAGDNLGTHIATMTLDMAGFQVKNVSTLTVTGSAFSVGGSTLVVANGNVGIGTAVPGVRFSLYNADESAALPMLRINAGTGGTAGSGGALEFLTGAENSPMGRIYTANQFSAGAGNSKGYLILSSYYNAYKNELTLYNGNVGIGTAPGANLHISSASASAAQTMLRISTGAPSVDIFAVKGDGRIYTVAGSTLIAVDSVGSSVSQIGFGLGSYESPYFPSGLSVDARTTATGPAITVWGADTSAGNAVIAEYPAYGGAPYFQVSKEGKIRTGPSWAVPVNQLDVIGGAAIGYPFVEATAPANGLIVTGDVGIATAAPQGRLDVLAGGAGPGTMATIWRNSAGTIVSSVSATGVIMASKFIGDGSRLTGAGDNLGTHIATMTLDMAGFQVKNVSTLTVTGNAFSVGGSTLAVVYGKVGIGAVSPNAKLDVVGNELRHGPVSYPASYSTTNSGYLVLDKSGTAGDASIVLRDQGNARAEIGIVTDNDIHFKTVTGTYGSESFTDRVLIRATGETDAFGPLRSYATSGVAKVFAGNSDGSSAGAALELTYDFGSSLSRITSIERGNVYRDLIVEGNALRFQSGASSVKEAMRITNAGNIGIGTASPAANLHISSTSASAAQNMLQITTGTTGADVFVVKGSGEINIRGKVGIGGTAYYGNNFFSFMAGGGYGKAGLAFDDGSTNGFQLYHDGGTSFAFQGSGGGANWIFKPGNIGLSTGVPQARLDVLAAGSTPADMATIWRNSAGTIVSSVSATGVIMASKFIGDGSGLSSISATDNTKVAKAGDTMTGQLTTQSTITVKGSAFSVGGSTLVVAGGAVGIGTNVPRNTFEVKDLIYFSTHNYSVSLGQQAGSSNIADNNVFIGYDAGHDHVTGTDNVFIGKEAGYYNSAGSWNYFLGTRSGLNSTGNNNIFIGSDSGNATTTGGENTFIGTGAGYLNTTGYENMFLGYQTGYNNTTAGVNVCIGLQSCYQNQTGDKNTIIGYKAGYGTAGNSTSYNTMLGYQAGYSTLDGWGNVFIGPETGYSNTEGIGNVFVGGYFTGYHNTSGHDNTFLGGQYTGEANTTGSENLFFGSYTGQANTTGSANSFFGVMAGEANTVGRYNSFLGYASGDSNTTGESNSIVGFKAGYNTATGSANAIFGNEAGGASGGSTNSFSSSTIVGYRSGYSLTTGGDNILLGWQAGYAVTTGTGNIVIGYNKDTSDPAANNELNIGGLLYGNLDARTVGISTRNPQAALDVVSTGTAANVYAQIWRNSTGVAVASVTARGDVSAARYQIAGSTVLAILPGAGSFSAGVDAGRVNGGDQNTFVGYQAGYSNTTAASNTFLGHLAGYSNTTGYNNLFEGFRAGYSNTIGYNNTFTGLWAGTGNTRGQNNSYFGAGAAQNSVYGSGNVVLGFEAAKGTFGQSFSSTTIAGYQAGYSLTTGSDNILLGYKAGYSVTTGTGNIIIGYNVGPSGATANNEINIGGVYKGNVSSGTATIAKVTVQAADSGITLTSADYGKTITVNSASAQTVTLPSVTSADLGATITIVKLGAGKVTIQAAASSYIADSSAAGTLYNSAVSPAYASVTLVLVSSNRWMLVGGYGAWITT